MDRYTMEFNKYRMMYYQGTGEFTVGPDKEWEE